MLLVPTYTPIRTDEVDVSIRRVFFGGINVYLQQKFAVFRRTPWWMDRLLDHPALLERVSQRGVSIQPAELGEMTVSMLRGEAGNQRKEIEKLVDLADHRGEAGRGTSVELDANRNGADAQGAMRSARGMSTFG